MLITVNGRSTELPDASSVAALLAQLRLGERRIAVEINGEILARSQAAQTALKPGDRVEIVHAIGGG